MSASRCLNCGEDSIEQIEHNSELLNVCHSCGESSKAVNLDLVQSYNGPTSPERKVALIFYFFFIFFFVNEFFFFFFQGNRGGAPNWTSSNGVPTIKLPNAANELKAFVGKRRNCEIRLNTFVADLCLTSSSSIAQQSLHLLRKVTFPGKNSRQIQYLKLYCFPRLIWLVGLMTPTAWRLLAFSRP